MDTMMALRAHARGDPEQLVYERVPRPVAGPGEALVAVRAAGITFDELTWDLSWTTRDGADRTPVIPSHEVSAGSPPRDPGSRAWRRATRSMPSSTSTGTARPRST
jgi:hypothetical protein